jgi:hypothetical protein
MIFPAINLHYKGFSMAMLNKQRVNQTSCYSHLLSPSPPAEDRLYSKHCASDRHRIPPLVRNGGMGMGKWDDSDGELYNMILIIVIPSGYLT